VCARQYNQSPKQKLRIKQYCAEPTNKKQKQQYDRGYKKRYRSVPENVQRAREYGRAYQTAWLSDPVNRAHKNDYERQHRSTPEYKSSRRKYEREYRKQRKAKDIQFLLACLLRDRFSHALKNSVKGGSAVKDLGCTIADAQRYLEFQFKSGWTWKNQGKVWVIDHIVPLCSFDLSDPSQVRLACHYSNLRPIAKLDNLRKSTSDKRLSIRKKR
jgi:hypothetical protein